MSLMLPALPRTTQYTVRKQSFGRDHTPVLGGPVLRLAGLGTRWAFDVSIPALAAAACGASLTMDLERGETETVVMVIPEPGTERASFGSSVRVNGAGQLGMTLNVDGLPANKAVPKGKWLSLLIGGQRFAYRTTAAVVANASGSVALPIFPMLRRQPVNDDVVELAEPKIEGFVAMDIEHSLRAIGTTGAVGIDFTISERE